MKMMKAQSENDNPDPPPPGGKFYFISCIKGKEIFINLIIYLLIQLFIYLIICLLFILNCK